MNWLWKENSDLDQVECETIPACASSGPGQEDFAAAELWLWLQKGKKEELEHGMWAGSVRTPCVDAGFFFFLRGSHSTLY
jgi:hypothetical protein